MTGERPLEPDDAELRALLATATDYVAGVVDALPTGPAVDLTGIPDLVADPDLVRPPPEHGRPLPELLHVLDRAAAKGHINPSGGHMAYIPGSGVVSAAVADLVADVLNRYTGLAAAGPGLVALETAVLRWLADLFELPPSAGGILTTGGSLAAFSALVTARQARLPEDFLPGTVYVSDQAHQSVLKAARLAGFPDRAVRVVPADAAQQLDVEAVRAAVRADRAAGRQPFCLVATAGTTNTGAVDPLPEAAQLAEDEQLWLHVDAAYGGFFQLTDRGRNRLQGIDRADSLVLDAHKGLFLPFGTGCLLVRDAELLRRAHTGSPDGRSAHYLQDIGQAGLPDFAEISPELTRDARGVRLWLPLHLHGVAAFRAALDEKLDLARYAYDELSADPYLAVLGRPVLSILVFHVRLPGRPTTDEDEATAELLRRVNAEQRTFLSSTRVAGRHVGRMAVLNHRTDQDRVAEAVASVRGHAAALAAEYR
jgi:aromatic-L-amino-acid decarboxylase